MTRTNRKLHIRALAVFLVLVNLLTLMPLPTHSSENDPVSVQTGGASFAIASDDGPVGSMTIFSYEKKEISVEGNTSADAYQWQIRHPQKTDLWVNIYDATSGCLPVTLALVKNMLDSSNSTQLRCRVNADGCEYYTAPLTVTYSSEDDGLPVVLADPTEPTIPEETIPETTVPEETVPETTVPEETIPETTIPEETVPETTIPEETVPETTIPEETIPETTVPEETVPETTISEEAIPAETEAEAPVLPAVVEEVVAVEEEVIVEEEEEEVVAAPVMAAAAPAAEESSAEDSTPIEEDTPAPAAEEPPVEENIPAPMAEGDSGTEPVTKEFVTVTVKYSSYDFAKSADGKLALDPDTKQPYLTITAEEAFTSYVAKLQYGSDLLNTDVPCPSMVGYDIEAGDSKTNIITNAETGAKYVRINLEDITDDVTYYVKYVPAEVSYAVRYYFQNVYDDLYVENTDMKYTGTAKTGTTPSVDIVKTYVPGFTCLYYEPDFIAADGSTVFASYYERNYYLMEFDCDGGYGTDTLYVRYGSYISVSSPVKAGWVFDGWDLVQQEKLDADGRPELDTDGNVVVENKEDGTKDDLPDEMPCYNTAYKAIWDEADATYTVAYWLRNEGSMDAYLGGYIKSGETGTDAVGGNTLGHDNIGAVCGKYGHTHTADCFTCGILAHEHSNECLTDEITVEGIVTNSNDMAAINAAKAAAGSKIDEDGVYLYLIQANSDLNIQYWPKLYLNGNYYTINTEGHGNSIPVGQLNKIAVESEIANATATSGNKYKATIYKAKLDCGQELTHSHSTTCYICGLAPHTHDLSCYAGNLEKGPAVNTDSDESWPAIMKINNDIMDTTEGYFYFTGGINTGRYYPKMFFNGKLYEVKINGNVYINIDTLNSIVDGTELGYETNGSSFAAKYKAKVACGLVEHAHDETCYKCGLHEHTDACRQDAHYLNYLNIDTETTVDGNGSTVVNVYYSYKTYTLRYYYAKKEDKYWDDENSKVVTGDKYYVVGGTTWTFGGYGGGVNENSSVVELLGNIGISEWGEVQEEPQIQAKYLPGGLDPRYTTGTTSATRVVSDKDPNKEKTNITYYYLEYEATYGQELDQLWPVDIFEPVKVANKTTQCPDLEYAYFSAWNGEYCTKYSTDTRAGHHGGNYTIKGMYMELDEEIIFSRDYAEKTVTKDGRTTPLVNFVGFWDNGVDQKKVNGWSVPKEFHYHIMLKSDDKEEIAGKIYDTYDGTKYEQYKEFLIYDNSDLNDINEQTVIALEGYTNVGTVAKNADFNKDHANGKLESVDYYFYYDPTIHKITFWNHSEYLMSGTGSYIAYGTDLSKYGAYANNLVYNAETNPKGKYPSTLEPGAYKFDGWYSTSQCLDGTEINWNQTMPDNDFVAYAKWIPVTRNVSFYLTYDDMVAGDTWDTTDIHGKPVTYPIVVDHGTELGTTYNFIPTRIETVNGKEVKYDFVGWFYIDEDNKKRFAPDSMVVNRDLKLFAEWATSLDTEYQVTYVLAEEATGNDGVKYSAGTQIAGVLSGHASVGQTKTFNAKAMGELNGPFQSKFFPTVNSHSILMAERNETNTQNQYKFEYVHDERVYYKVRYLEAGTNKVLHTEEIKSSENAIVTEKFLPISNYVPQSFYIRKTLASDGSNTSSDQVLDMNVITFYYVLDLKHGMYSVEYYLENQDSEEAPVLPANPTEEQRKTYEAELEEYLEKNYTIRDSKVGPSDLNQPITAEIRSYEGFTYTPEYNAVINYVSRDEDNELVLDENNQPVMEDPPILKRGTEAGNPPKGTVDVGGLTIKIYYKRNSYPYEVQYRDANTNALLKTEATGSAYYDQSIEHTAPATFVDDKNTEATSDDITYEYYIPKATDEQRTKTRTIRVFTGDDSSTPEVETNPNVLVFYYTQKQVEVQYHAVWFDSDKYPAAEYGNVSINAEKGTITGSTATPAFGFLFDGWYKDEACTPTQLVDDTWVTGSKLIPQELYQDDDWINHYYAKFVAVQRDLTITKFGTGLNKDDSFLFRITGRDALNQDVDMIVSIQGAGSVTIKDLYCGTYTVTELTGWSWTYDVKSASSQEASLTVNGEDGEVTFTNAPKENIDWLHGETNNENQFKTNP